MTKDEALDLALEALSLTADRMKIQRDAITAIKQARALDKKAENARELGLDYEPSAKVRDFWEGYVPEPQYSVNCVNHDCDKCKAAAQPAPVQEPVAWVDLLKQAEEVVRSKSLWKKYIDGTPLANDIAVWMANFAQEHTTPPAAQPAPVQEPVWCNHCNGSGRMVRDPDIGTDQECFVCDGAGVPAAPVQEPVAFKHVCNLWIDPVTTEYIVDHCDHPPSECIPAYIGTPPAQPAPVHKPYRPLQDNGSQYYGDSWDTPPTQSAPVQGPVAWAWRISPNADHWQFSDEPHPEATRKRPLVFGDTTPTAAQRQWVGLTDEERGQVINSNFGTGLWRMAKDIEAKLRSKNT